ncbi:MAG: hypothetical protein ABSD78_16760 [Acidimicrobiales bacterium]|jgi:hypothetical protein
MSTTSLPERALKLVRVDWSPRHRQPSVPALLLATILSVVGSLAVDALLVLIGTSVFPATKGYVHFRASDYGTLTTIGVLIACAGWPTVARITSAPRWLFLRLAVLVTLVLWLPDIWLLLRNQPVRAVAVLMVMHLSIAVVTYNALVRVAPVREGGAPRPANQGVTTVDGGVPLGRTVPAGDPGTARESSNRRLALSLSVLVAIEFFLGVAALLLVPAGRSSGWLPTKGATVYLAHAVLGLPLALGAVTLLLRVRGSTRTFRATGWVGLVGVAMAGIGGLVTVSHPLRLLGMAFMFVGPMIAGLAYLIPTFDQLPTKAPQAPRASQPPQAPQAPQAPLRG